MNTTTTQMQKKHGVGFLLAAPFVLSWKAVAIVFSVIMEIRAMGHQPTQDEREAQYAETDLKRAQDHQHDLDDFHEEMHQAVLNDATLGHRF